MPSFIELTGKRFGRLKVIRRDGTSPHKHPTWLCECSCGNSHVVTGQTLVNGSSMSCGCFNKDQKRAMCIERNTTHGMSDTKVHNTWVNIITRCYNRKSTGYHKYGAKGIRVCKRWRHNFAHFLADMGEPPTAKHTIDRRDNKKGYSPDNCRWATMKEQQNNRGNNRKFTYRGRTMGIAQWAQAIGKCTNTIRDRMNAGAPLAVILSKRRFGRWNPLPLK